MTAEDMMVEMKEIASDLVNAFCCLVTICLDDKIIPNDTA